MNNNQIFDLERIKELTKPIEELQTKVNQLNESSKTVLNNINIIKKENENEKFISQVETIQEILNHIFNKLNSVSKKNLLKFLEFQDHLIKKYKENFKKNLKKLNLNEKITKTIGLYLIDKKLICKIIENVSYVQAIQISEWLELLDSLKYNTIFLKSINQIGKYFQNLIEIRLNKELNKIPTHTDPILIKDYNDYFKKNPKSTFEEFLQIIESQLTQEELESKKKTRKRLKEREELEKLKLKQEQQKKTYEDYLKLSESEFERLRRKKRREKLTEVSNNSKNGKQIEISDEISEKIKKFKSQFEKSFEEKYMIRKDDDSDPIDIIRERKKKKEKEYKKYKDHFENT